MRRLALIALVPMLLAADTAVDRLARVRTRHDVAVQAAADLYWRQKQSADQAYLEALATQLRTAPSDALKAERDRAQADVSTDAGAIKAHTPLTTVAAVTADIKEAEWKANMTPPIEKAIADHKLLAGMTVDQANAAMGVKGEQAGGDANGTSWTWTLSHEVPMQGGSVSRGMDYGEAAAAILEARANANRPRPRIVDAVWTARVEGGRLVGFDRTR
jgi:hypothetical protein